MSSMPPNHSSTIINGAYYPERHSESNVELIGGTFVVLDAKMERPTQLQIAQMTAILSQRRREQRQQQFNENAARARERASEVEHALFEADPMEFP